MKTSKILALVLAVAMIMSTMGIVTFADANTVTLPDGMTEDSFTENYVVYVDSANDTVDGYYTSLLDAFNAAHKNEATLYVKPGATLASPSAHQLHVCKNLTVYGNGATLSSTSDIELGFYTKDECEGITEELSLNVYSLNNISVWGARTTTATLNILLDGCISENGAIMMRGASTDGAVTNITVNSCVFNRTTETDAIHSIYGGKVVVTNTTFNGYPNGINLAKKTTDDLTVSLSECTFTDCGHSDNTDIAAYCAPVRVVANNDEGKVTLNVTKCNFKNEKAVNGDILIGDGRDGKESYAVVASIENTAAEVQIQEPGDKTAGTAEVIEVSANANVTLSNADFLANGVAYKTIAEALKNIGDDKTITLLDDVTFDTKLVVDANGDDLIIDLDGNTITFAAGDNAFAKGNITVKNGIIDVVDGLKASGEVVITTGYAHSSDTVLTFDGVTMNIPNVTVPCGVLGIQGTNTLVIRNSTLDIGTTVGTATNDIFYANDQSGNLKLSNVDMTIDETYILTYGCDMEIDDLTLNGNVTGSVFFVSSGLISNSEITVDNPSRIYVNGGDYGIKNRALSFENTKVVATNGCKNEDWYRATGEGGGVYADAASDLGVTDGIETLVAKIGNKGYASIQNAIDAAEADTVVEILYSEEAYPQFRVPKNKPLTLRGIPKTTAARSLSGTNPVISITDLNNYWDRSVSGGKVETGTTYESKVTVENLDFVVEEDAVGSGYMGVFSYLPDGQSVDGSSFTNCNFVNKSDLEDVKAIIAHAEDITVTNCTFENFKTAVYCCNEVGTLDEYSITNSTFDKVDYIIDGYWGYGEADSAFTFTGNTVNDARTNGAVPTFIVWDFAYTTNNGGVPSVKNINIANNTYKTKAELVTIDMTSNTTVATDATWVKTYGTVERATNSGTLAENEIFYLSKGYSLKDEAYKLNAEGIAIELEGGEITVVFESIKDENDKDTGAWNIVLQAAENTELFEFVSAELKFINGSQVEGGFNNEKMHYNVEGTTDISVTKNLDENHEATYAFYLNAQDANGNLVTRPSGDKIVIGKVVFDGKGTMELSVDASSRVIGTVYGTNDEAVFVANDENAEYVLNVKESNLSSNDVLTTKRNVKIAIEFEHDINEDVLDNYKFMTVTLKDSIGNTFTKEGADINIKGVNSGEVVFENVTIGIITVTLKAPGFRTYTYQTTMEDIDAEFVLNFWNSVKRSGDWCIEEGNDRSKMMHNFLAGDIAMDYIIDKYDLAAVTSYYGIYDINDSTDTKYIEKLVKYDLNRDGDIDILDVAYVLHGMGN